MPAAVWYPEQNSATWYVSQHVNVRRHAGYSGRIIATNQVVACVQRDHAGQPAIESCADLARMRGRPRKGTNVVAFPKTPAHRPPRPPIPKPIIVNRVEHWVRTAIKVLRCDANGNPLIVKGKPATGIHSVFSGFNEAFRKAFPNLDPVAVTKALAEAGEIVIGPAHGGVILYLPKQAPISGATALAKINSVLKK